MNLLHNVFIIQVKLFLNIKKLKAYFKFNNHLKYIIIFLSLIKIFEFNKTKTKILDKNLNIIKKFNKIVLNIICLKIQTNK